MSLSSECDSWQQSSEVGSRRILQIYKVEEDEKRLNAQLGQHLVTIIVPADADCVFETDTNDSSLIEWQSIMATFAFETENLTLKQFLDKSVAVFCKLFPNEAHSPAAVMSASSTPVVASKPSPASAIAASPSTASAMEIDEDEEGFGDAADVDEEGFGVGGDEDDDDGWGSLKEHTGDEEIHDAAWTKQKELKKRLMAKAESVRASMAHVSEQQKTGQKISTIFSSDATVSMLVNDVMSYMASSDASLQVHPVDDNPFTWCVKLSQFPADSLIQAGLMHLKSLYNYDSVELELRMMPDLYPFFPPSVRIVRPRFKRFMLGRLVCMPEIQLSNWNPTRTLRDIFDSIRRVLTTHGEVDNLDPEMNDPDSGIDSYSALEFELLRLTMLTDIQPRAVKTMDDADAIKLFAPKQKSKAELEKEKGKEKEKEANKTVQPLVASDHFYKNGVGNFKKGTGYGGGSNATSTWDPQAWSAAQAKKDSEICEIANSIAKEMGSSNISDNLASVLENSCLVPFLAQYLATDSITEMESHTALYHSVLETCEHMCKHSNLINLFELLPGEKKSLAAYLQQLQAMAKVVSKFEKFSSNDAVPSTTASTSGKKSKNAGDKLAVDPYKISLVKHVLQVADVVQKKLDEYRKTRPATDVNMTDANSSTPSAAEGAASSSDSPAAADASSSSSSSSSSAITATDADYVRIMTPHRFGDVEQFDAHHYFKEHHSTSSALNRQWVKRVSTEYADLSNSLPIHAQSSAFLRYKEDSMGFCQFLVAAPDETPYGYGLFLFDSYFPNTYPNGPPLVNLQTTGGGSVRFNPNLYNCGKVCLSLLGTWSGGAGENWSALTSTFLQVIVSIQSLIFVPEPYFNEPGYQSSYGTPNGKMQSDQYNKVIEVATIKFAMIDMMKKPPAWAKDIVRSHFCLHRINIMKQCRQWAKKNSGVKDLLPQLEKLLEEQSLPDGSKPVIKPTESNSTTATAVADESLATPASASATSPASANAMAVSSPASASPEQTSQ